MSRVGRVAGGLAGGRREPGRVGRAMAAFLGLGLGLQAGDRAVGARHGRSAQRAAHGVQPDGRVEERPERWPADRAGGPDRDGVGGRPTQGDPPDDDRQDDDREDDEQFGGHHGGGDASTAGLAAMYPGRPGGHARVVVRLGLELLGSPEGAARRPEQDQPGHHEHAQERVQLGHLGQEQGDEPEARADAVDDQDRVAVRQAQVEQPMVDVRPVRR